MKKHALFFAVVMCLILAASPAASPQAATVTCDTYEGENVDNQSYSRYASPIESYLTLCEDGTLMRVQFLSSSEGVLVEYYDTSYNLLSSRKIAMELPYFGGFYAAEDAYFLLTGQSNIEESADVEVFRISKYDKNWNFIASDGLYDCNTTVPFDAGSARFAVSGKYLMIRTAHEMYTASDGYNHQANVTIQVDMDTVTITDSYTRVMNSGYGYISHSFNQFIQIENNKIVAVDHGDAHPRSAALIQYVTDVSTGKFTPDYYTRCTVTSLMTYPGAVGENVTGATIGGFEISDSAYLVAGNSVVQDEANLTRSTRNIYVIAMNKSTSAVQTNWITNYAEGEETTSTPHMVKIGDSSYLLLWTRGGSVYYTRIDGNGNQVGQIYSMAGELSDCVPVVCGSRLVWYTWNYDTNVFYDINLNQLSETHAVSITNGHSYENQGVVDGTATLYCTRCGITDTITVPSAFGAYWNYTTGTGSYTSALKSRTVGEPLYWWWYITAPSERDDSTMIVEVSDPSKVKVEPSKRDGTMGKMTMLKSGTVTLKVYPKYNPDLSRTYTLTINPQLIDLTYDANGGTNAPAAHTIPSGENFELSAQVPVRTGYTFAGWYTQPSGGTKVTADTVFTQDTTVYAQWKSGAPSKVTGVTAVFQDGQIKVTWNNNNAVKYRVLRFDGNGYTTLTYGASAAEGYTDTDLIDAHRYFYRICGYFYDSAGNLVQGSVSDAVGVVATDHAPAKVENLTASGSSGNMLLSWDAADGARYYKISRAPGWSTADGSYRCLQYNVEPASYKDTSVTAGKWRYKVVGYYKAVDGSWTYGDMSATLFVTVK